MPAATRATLAVLTCVGAMALAGSRASAQHMVQLPGQIPVPLVDLGSAVLWVSEDSAVRATAHIPGAFELWVSMSATETAQITARLQPMDLVNGSLHFSAADRDVWCYPPRMGCPQYNGWLYYGFRVTLNDGVHYGWLSTYFADLGFGNIELRIETAAYDDRPGQDVRVGMLDHPAPGCGSTDFNCDGDTATDADIEAFFACLSGFCPAAPCASTADFNRDGDAGTDLDIEAFFLVLAGQPCQPW